MIKIIKTFREWRAKRWIRKYLSKCDLEKAKGMLVHALGGGVLPNELVQILKDFDEDPCIDAAMDLIRYDNKFAEVFSLSRKDEFKIMWNKRKRKHIVYRDKLE